MIGKIARLVENVHVCCTIFPPLPPPLPLLGFLAFFSIFYLPLLMSGVIRFLPARRSNKGDFVGHVGERLFRLLVFCRLFFIFLFFDRVLLLERVLCG